MIKGVIHILGVDGGDLLVVFTAHDGTGRHGVSSRAAAERFIVQTLHCNLKAGDMDHLMPNESNAPNHSPIGIEAQITMELYKAHFSK